MIYGNVLRSPEICYKCVAHSHIPSTSLSSLSLYRCLSRCQCHTHMKMFYKQYSSWFLCVFVHSFNYLAIKYDEPRSPSLVLERSHSLSPLGCAYSRIVGTLWPRAVATACPCGFPATFHSWHRETLCYKAYICFYSQLAISFFWLTKVLASKYSGHSKRATLR